MIDHNSAVGLSLLIVCNWGWPINCVLFRWKRVNRQLELVQMGHKDG